MSRLITIVAALLGALSLVASSAVASPPTREWFGGDFTFEDTGTCPGITIVQHNVEWGTFTEFSPTRWRLQFHGAGTMSANGKTVTTNFNAVVLFDPTTTVQKVVGTVYNVQVPGVGNLLLDAGSIVFDVSTDPVTVLRVGGPHQQFGAQFFGDPAPLCDYLAAA